MDRRKLLKGGIVAGAVAAGAYTPPSLRVLVIPVAAQTLSPLGSNAPLPPLPGGDAVPPLPPLPNVGVPTVVVDSGCFAGDTAHRGFLAVRLAAPVPTSGMLFIDNQFMTSPLPAGDASGFQAIGFRTIGTTFDLARGMVSPGTHTAEVRAGLLGPVIASVTFTVTAC